MAINDRAELVKELRAMAERNQLKAPQLEGPDATTVDCMKCGVLGCNLIEANE